MIRFRQGIDLIECRRIGELMERYGERFLTRVLTEGEIRRAGLYRDATTFVAGRWAAKESILKMIGTGWRGGIAWTDMQILPDELGEPIVQLSGETARIARNLGLSKVLVSITHTREYAAASAIGYADGEG